MMVGAFLNGVHPRSEALMRATWEADKGAASRAALDEAVKRDVAALAAAQQEASFSHFTDGNLRWPDLLRPFVEACSGLEVGALTRSFETNTFFKRPVVTGEPRLKDAKGFLKAHFDTEALPRGGGWKAVLPSPYHLAAVAEVRAGKRDEAAYAFARVLNEVAQQLMKNRYQFIQFNEPSFLYAQRGGEEWDLLLGAVKEAARGIGVTTCLHLFHGDPTPHVERLQEAPVDAVGIDFTLVHVERLPKLKYEKGLNAGVVDAQNSLLEEPARVAKLASAVYERLEPEDFWLAPNTDLEFVPQPIAAEKVRVLGLAAKETLAGREVVR